MTTRSGWIFGFAAYLSWGAFPLFFSLLAPVDPWEIVPWRVLTAAAFCVILVTLIRAWRPIWRIARSPRRLGWFVLSSLLLYANWQVFVIGIVTGHVIEASLGYFINPLFTILLGVLLRRERLRPAQWTAVGVATVGVVVSAVAMGAFPWIALGLALTFALYGAVRKQMSEDIDALHGLTVETLIAVPVALGQLALLPLLGIALTAFTHGTAVTIPLLLTGTVTAIPLLFFGGANRRLPLTHLGFLQFLTPILGFLSGYFLFGEVMTPVRWFGFITVWVALTILLADMTVALRDHRRRARIEAAVTGEIPT